MVNFSVIPRHVTLSNIVDHKYCKGPQSMGLYEWATMKPWMKHCGQHFDVKRIKSCPNPRFALVYILWKSHWKILPMKVSNIAVRFRNSFSSEEQHHSHTTPTIAMRVQSMEIPRQILPQLKTGRTSSANKVVRPIFKSQELSLELAMPHVFPRQEPADEEDDRYTITIDRTGRRIFRVHQIATVETLR
ncbi:hypothetical protein PROFUN_10749 [Planoprotostelium fungivorum]|uniref:Uncharacterized protein n=1 Tax=Planoprotostelium fungivorum TaxID=1890364 RepID=A0A2P6N7Y2_9EUKA|nr:hypothetical protein PROFUN_10749 [Planoprotostelium fungivorum]